MNPTKILIGYFIIYKQKFSVLQYKILLITQPTVRVMLLNTTRYLSLTKQRFLQPFHKYTIREFDVFFKPSH